MVGAGAMLRGWGKTHERKSHPHRFASRGRVVRGLLIVPLAMLLAGCSYGLPQVWKPIDIAVPDGLMDAEQQKAAIDEMVQRRDSHTVRTVAAIEGARSN